MFNMYDRTFIVPNETEKELKVPAMDGRDGKLMAGLTQENVEMNKRISIERARAMKRETELHDEMHTFGMIECSVFDDRAKLMRVHVKRNQAFSVSVISSALSPVEFVESTISGALEAAHDICLFPINYEYEGGIVSMVESSGTFWNNGKLFVCRLSYDTSGDEAILSVNLAGGIFENGRICIPDTKMTQVLIDMNEIDCYM